MKKKKLLIVAHHLTIGGVQKSLIAALKAIDYEKFDVTLYLRKNRTDLLSLVDERVNVIGHLNTTDFIISKVKEGRKFTFVNKYE